MEIIRRLPVCVRARTGRRRFTQINGLTQRRKAAKEELMSKGRRRKEKIRNRLKDIRRALFPLSFSVVYGSNIKKPNQI